MTGPELLAALRTLGWTNVNLAERMGCSEMLVRRMLAGQRTIEPELAAWLHKAVAWFEAHPLPALKERRGGRPRSVGLPPAISSQAHTRQRKQSG